MRTDVTLRRLDEDLLQELLDVAVVEADLYEVMPPVAGPPGWTGVGWTLRPPGRAEVDDRADELARQYGHRPPAPVYRVRHHGPSRWMGHGVVNGTCSARSWSQHQSAWQTNIHSVP